MLLLESKRWVWSLECSRTTASHTKYANIEPDRLFRGHAKVLDHEGQKGPDDVHGEAFDDVHHAQDRQNTPRDAAFGRACRHRRSGRHDDDDRVAKLLHCILSSDLRQVSLTRQAQQAGSTSVTLSLQRMTHPFGKRIHRGLQQGGGLHVI